MRIPSDWSPYRIEGGCDQGEMDVTNGETNTINITWTRPGKRFDSRKWLERTARANSKGDYQPDAVESASDWENIFIPGEHLKARSDVARWFGYSPKADLQLELEFTKAVDPKRLRWIRSNLIPSIDSWDKDGPSRWAVMDVSFELPAEYKYEQHQLRVGDIALRFSASRREHLIVRQVYPASMALNRRSLEHWVGAATFSFQETLKDSAPPEEITIESFGRELSGFARVGTRRRPLPLGWIKSDYGVAVGVVDEELQRVLLAELDAIKPVSDDAIRQCVARMNWARKEQN